MAIGAILAGLGAASQVAGMFGGGDNGAATQIERAAQSARNDVQTGIGQLGYLYGQGRDVYNNMYNTAIGQIGPQTIGSYSALDSYFNALGIPVVEGGSAQLASAMQFGANYKPKLTKEYQSTLDNAVNAVKGTAGPYGGLYNDFWGSGLQDAINTGDNEKLVQYLKTLPASMTSNIAASDDKRKAVRGDSVNAAVNAINQLNNYQGEKTVALTAQEQALMDEFNKYKMGELGYNTADPNSIAAKLAATPGYRFALDQGQNAISNNAASRGLLLSGGTLKALQQFGTGLADQTYQSYVSNMAGAAGLTSPYAGQSSNTSSTAGGNLLGSYMQQGNATADAYNNLANIAMGSGGAQAGLLGTQAQAQSAGFTGLGKSLTSLAGYLG